MQVNDDVTTTPAYRVDTSSVPLPPATEQPNPVDGTGASYREGFEPAESLAAPPLPTGAHPGGFLSSWMRSIPNDTLVIDINIPGTHDSAAINRTFITPFACQNSSISNQLDAGIRLLDVRLRVNEVLTFGIVESAVAAILGTENPVVDYEIMTCHGSAAGNEYRSFVSLLKECTAFLDRNPTETIVMSLKVDDWNHCGDEGRAKTKIHNVLNDFGTYIMPRSAHNTRAVSLGESRKKMNLINRITDNNDFGIPIEVPDNTAGQLLGRTNGRNFDVFIQDKYEGLETNYAEREKLIIFGKAMHQKIDGRAVINFASATQLKLFGVNIKEGFIAYIGATPVQYRLRRTGWSLFDNADEPFATDNCGVITCIDLIVASNFDNGGYQQEFKISKFPITPL